MSQQSGKSLFIVALLTGTLGYSGGAFAGCIPSVNGSSLANTCIGSDVLKNNDSGKNNSAMGMLTLGSNTSGSYNSAFGYAALYANKIGNHNSSVGMYSLFYNVNGEENSALGSYALSLNKTGNANTAIGAYALSNTTSGSNNIGIGRSAGQYLYSGNNNIDIANQGVAGDSGVIRIGAQGTQTKTFLAGIYGSNVSGSPVLVNSSGQLGVLKSSRRYKEHIKPMGSVSDKLLELRPVTFHYKKQDEEGKKPIQYGLIAEEVDAVMPELVVRNKDGSPETVAYQYIPSLLLNEYQKQHKELVDTKAKLVSIEAKEKNSEQQISELKSQVERLNAITKKLMAALPSNTKTAMAK